MSISIKFKQTISLGLIATSFISCSNDKIGKYTKEDLPSNFEYKILKDESNPNIEKNQLIVKINQKITEGQIATLAEELFNTKEKQKRFYIAYVLEGNENSVVYWANSDFDPELEITINGSITNEDNSMLQKAKEVQGKIIGVFKEDAYTFAFYTVYEDKGNLFVKTSFKNGQSMLEQVAKTDLMQKEYKLVNKDGSSNGEYYILKDGVLEFYNKENNKFTEAIKVE